VETELTTAPKKKLKQNIWQKQENPERKSERLQSKLYQITTLLNEINAEKTPVNSRNNSRDSSYSRNSSDRRKNQDRDRRTSSDKQSRSDSRDNDYSRQRTPTSYKSSRDEPRYPSRSYSSEISSRDSRNYRPESRNSEYSRSSEYLRKSRARSNSPYQNKTVIPGLNCSPNYKSGTNFCKKCLSEGHEEPYCTQYYHWSPLRCQQCNNGFHLANNHD
jgi:hypothetical protein